VSGHEDEQALIEITLPSLEALKAGGEVIAHAGEFSTDRSA
jgi:hypothetical protein